MESIHTHARSIYEIQVQGQLDRSWENFFDGLVITSGHAGGLSPTTTLVVPVTDQAALRGLLCKLWDLNMTLISVRQLGMEEVTDEGNDKNRKF